MDAQPRNPSNNAWPEENTAAETFQSATFSCSASSKNAAMATSDDVDNDKDEFVAPNIAKYGPHDI